METSYAATTIENDTKGFADLHNQLLTKAAEKTEKTPDVESKTQGKERQKEAASSKKFAFRKGEQSVELDDDYEIEFMADKKPTRMTLRELKDRAAGDVAVKNRMHALAEEKKRVQATLRQFADLSRQDPLGALEYISNKAKETDSEFEYGKYLEKLAEQAEKLGQMDEKERKAWELEKKLQKAESDLSQKERVEAVALRKQEMLADYPEIGDQQFGQMVDAVLSNEELSGGLNDEHEVMDRVEDLIQETLTQRDIISVIKEINSDHVQNNELIFSLSDQIRQNPDLDEEDIREIIRDVIGKKEPVRRNPSNERNRDIRTLSNKARQATPEMSLKTQNVDPYELLKDQLMDRKKEISRTPLYAR